MSTSHADFMNSLGKHWGDRNAAALEDNPKGISTCSDNNNNCYNCNYAFRIQSDYQFPDFDRHCGQYHKEPMNCKKENKS